MHVHNIYQENLYDKYHQLRNKFGIKMTGIPLDDETQDILMLGVPLENFTYPVYPNSYDQQHAVLRRFAGVFAPIASAVKVFSGFGTTVRTVAKPTASVESGTVESGTKVTFSTATEGATIKYTTDNSDPITNGTEYSGELTISATTTYKVVAVKSGFEPSEVATFTYTVA